MTYALEPADALEPARLEQVRRIYEAGFPEHLRAGFGTLVRQRQPGEVALALVSADGQPCGFAMLRPLGGAGWIYLRYFVIDAARRGRGLGGVLWGKLTARLSAAGYSLLAFDVEDPAEPGCGQQESRARSRRIEFYRRHGASVLPVHGYRTPHGDESGEWTPMVLMAAGLTGGRAAGGGPARDNDGPIATRDGVRAVVEAVYRHRWSLPPDHPHVASTRLADWPAGAG